MAGFFDAEGSIMIIHIKGGKNHNESFCPKISITINLS